VPAIILPDKWRQQPPGPASVNARWIGRGLTALYVLNARSWKVNAVTGKIGGTATGTGHTYGPESITSSGSGSEHIDFSVGVTPATIVIGYAMTSGGVAWSNLRRDVFDWSGLYDQLATSSNDFAGSIGPLPTRSGIIPTYAFRWSEQNNYRGVADGGAVTVDTSTGAVPGNRVSIALGVANRGVGGIDNPSVTRATLIAAFSQALSDPEMQEITAAPWGELISKKPRILYFNVAGGGATITGDSGSYTLTGTAATLKAGRKLAADSGTYNLTGTAATLKVGRKLTADSGTYTLTGTAVAFKRGYALGAESGTYTVSGTSVNLKAGRKLTADSGSYTLTGTDVTLNYSPAGSYNLTAESGTYTLTGTAATLKVSRKLTADSGAYTLTGTDVTLSKGVKLTADSGSYTLTGSNVAFARTYVLTAESGAYTLTGTSAGLTWSGAPVVEVPTNGGPSIYGKPVFREKQFRKEYEEQVKRIEDEKRLARILREDEEITVIMALMAA
jgi:hypothetical protein